MKIPNTMAKEDFCFTYYDGDAARDMSHMNRLERGCYNDLVLAQRKFGHLSKSLIEKVLSHDFEKCWGAIEIILKVDGEGKFFVEWLENSLLRSERFSKVQSGKRSGKTKHKPNRNRKEPNDNQTGTKKNLKEDGDGDGDEQGNRIRKKDMEQPELVFPFCSDAFNPVWNVLVKEKKWRNKSLSALQASLDKLSKYSEEDAIQMMKDSIAGEWQGLFEPKKSTNGNTNRSTGKQQKPWGTIDQHLKQHAAESAKHTS